jgi:hypothetical protein
MGSPHWTPAETEIAERMKAAGHSFSEIGERLGRSRKAVQLKFLYLRRTPEERRVCRGKTVYRPSRTGMFIQVSNRPTPEQIAERDARFSKDRTISQLIMGDPLPGQSALDKRKQEACHG